MNNVFKCIGVLGALLIGSAAFAMPQGGNAVLPWDAPLQTIVDSITGPFAFAAASIGMVIAGAILVFGNDLNRFGQSVMYLVLVIGLIVLGVNGMATLFTTGMVAQSVALSVALSALGLVSLSASIAKLQVAAVRFARSLFAKHKPVMA